MKAKLVIRQRVVVSDRAFAELVLWSLPRSVPASKHAWKYRLAFVVAGVCVLRYDNEAGKGVHRHIAGVEEPYRFIDVERLVSDFMSDVRRWVDDNGTP